MYKLFKTFIQSIFKKIKVAMMWVNIYFIFYIFNFLFYIVLTFIVIFFFVNRISKRQRRIERSVFVLKNNDLTYRGW